jgi:hypothetical protein
MTKKFQIFNYNRQMRYSNEILAIQIPYCHYFKAKGLFGSFLVKRLSNNFTLALTRYRLLEEDTSDY